MTQLWYATAFHTSAKTPGCHIQSLKSQIVAEMAESDAPNVEHRQIQHTQ